MHRIITRWILNTSLDGLKDKFSLARQSSRSITITRYYPKPENSRFVPAVQNRLMLALKRRIGAIVLETLKTITTYLAFPGVGCHEERRLALDVPRLYGHRWSKKRENTILPNMSDFLLSKHSFLTFRAAFSEFTQRIPKKIENVTNFGVEAIREKLLLSSWVPRELSTQKF